MNSPKNNNTSHFSIANKLMRQGKLEEAIACYRRALAQNPNFAWSHHNLGEALVKQGQLDEAIACYRNAIAQQPNFAWFHYNLAQALVKQGELEESLIFFRKAIELNPNLVHRNLPANHSLLYQLGYIFLQQGQTNEAVTCFLRAIQLKPDFTKSYLSLRYMLPLNRLDEAIACYRKAIELQPDFAWADICLGYALTRQGKHDEAIRCFQSASYKQTRISYPSFAEKQCNSNFISNPNFILCGVLKCGTTSLSKYIFQHPQVIPPIQKEIHFFSDEYSQGLDWYLAQFPSIPEGESFLTGEASPTYLTYIGAEKRIFEHFPQVKLICLLRNPVDRTISEYYHRRREGTENRSFEQAILSEIESLKGIEDSPAIDTEIAIRSQGIKYLKHSMYFYFIKKWMERFSSEQFLIVKSEDFYANTALIMQQVFDFLEIPYYQAAEYKKYMVGSYKPIGDNLRRQLSEFFIPHNQKLENYLGRKFNWE